MRNEGVDSHTVDGCEGGAVGGRGDGSSLYAVGDEAQHLH
jgi:hypothetical protein